MKSTREEKATECLQALELNPGASIDDVRNSYRTLAMVWHPDRFATNKKLYDLALERTKKLNAAYDWLRHNQDVLSYLNSPASNPGTSTTTSGQPHGTSPASHHEQKKKGPSTHQGSGADNQHKQHYPPPPPNSGDKARKASNDKHSATSAFLIIFGLITAILLFSVFLKETGNTSNNDALSGTNSPAREAANNGPQHSLSPPGSQAIGMSQQSDSGTSPEKNNEQELVFEPEESPEVERAISSTRPDLSGLSRDERSSIESVCGSAKVLEGPAAYNRCLRRHLEELRAGPSAPNLSGLSRDERSSIESVCGSAKVLEGPAAYNRCRHIQLRALRGNR